MVSSGAFVVMGVSGCGKSTVARELAEKINAGFIEADDWHPASNKQKMSSGVPLTDEDRLPWLAEVVSISIAEREKSGSVVVACSALKKSYRDQLRKIHNDTFFVYLSGSKALILQRMQERKGHFMPVALLDSQFDTLEDPRGEAGVVAVDIIDDIEAIVQDALQQLSDL